MGKVDELIDALAEHIKKRIDEGNDMENEITEKTKALAELVSARALMQNPSPVEALKAAFAAQAHQQVGEYQFVTTLQPSTVRKRGSNSERH